MIKWFISFLALISLSSQAQFQQKQIPFNTAASDNFGSSMAVYGNFAVAGAPLDDNTSVDQGSVTVFQYNNNVWTEFTTLYAPDANVGDNFGISVDIFDTTIVIGASFTDDNGLNSGAVYIYKYSGSTWVFEDKLTASDGSSEDEFGHSVALNNNNLLIGAYREDGNGATNRGAVYFFSSNGSIWSENQKIVYNLASNDDFFGYDLALENNRAVIGAYLDDDNGVNSGSAFVYEFDGTTWNVTQKLLPSNGAGGDAFGFSVDLWQNTIVCGAYANSIPVPTAGAVYIFELNGTWVEDTILRANDANIDDWFGFDIALDSNTLMIGAFHNDDHGAESGSAYLFRHTGSDWLQELNLKAGDAALGDEFGKAVAVESNQVIIGAAMNDDNGTNSGSVYCYPLCLYTPRQELCIVSAEHTLDDNLLVWSKPKTTFIDSFIIHRNGNGIDKIAYTSSADYIDAIDPSFGPIDYALTTQNFCSNLSDTSDIHTTNHLVGSINGSGQYQLNWTGHTGIPVIYYRIWRDTNQSGNFHLIAATLASQLSYTDPYQSTNGTPAYFVEIEKSSSCNSNNASISSNYSNIFNFIELSQPTIIADKITIYPNPTHDYFWFKGISNVANITIHNQFGQLIKTVTKNEADKISVQELPAGIYYIEIKDRDHSSIKKLVVR